MKLKPLLEMTAYPASSGSTVFHQLGETLAEFGLYGPTERYVSRQRLESMLELEFTQLVEQLQQKRGDAKSFFVFADTVATRRFRQNGNGRGWLGIRSQARPHDEPPQIIVHAHLFDSTAWREQEALGSDSGIAV